MLKDFKEFILRGNVIDLAIGFIVGAAFGKIVSSLVSDVLMPPIGLILGNIDFSNLFINLSGADYSSLKAAKDAGAATINYGLFINTLIDFLIIAFVLFIVIKFINRAHRKQAEVVAPPSTKDCPYCFSAISLKAIRCPHCTSELKL